MRIFSQLSLLMAFALNATVVMAAALTPQELENLGNYETKLFAHPFAADSVPARLDRIEDFVFGKTSEGTDQDRLGHLVATLGAVEADNSKASDQPKGKEEPPVPQAKPDQDRVSNNVLSTNSRTGLATEGRPSGQVDRKDKTVPEARLKKGEPMPPARVAHDPVETGEGFKKSDYPRVAKLELKTLGLTYDEDPLDERVDRLEIKAFKRPSNIDDLSERIDALEKYVGPSRKITYTSPDSNADQNRAIAKGRDHSDWDEGEGEIASAQPPGRSYSYPDPYTSPESYSGANPYTWNSSGSSSSQLYGGPSLYSSNRSFLSPGSTNLYRRPGAGTSAPSLRPSYRRNIGALDKEAEEMERAVLGKTFKHDALVDRLNRLEETVFSGQAGPKGMTIPQRFERLANALGPVGENRTATANGDNQSDWFNNSNSDIQTGVLTNEEKHSFLGGLGRALGSFAGGAMNSYNMSNNNPYGYGVSPYGYNPYGGAYAPYGGMYNPYGGSSSFASPFGNIGGFGTPFGSPLGGFGGLSSPFGGTYTGLPGTGFGGSGGIGNIGNPFFGGTNRVWIR